MQLSTQQTTAKLSTDMHIHTTQLAPDNSRTMSTVQCQAPDQTLRIYQTTAYPCQMLIARRLIKRNALCTAELTSCCAAWPMQCIWQHHVLHCNACHRQVLCAVKTFSCLRRWHTHSTTFYTNVAMTWQAERKRSKMHCY